MTDTGHKLTLDQPAVYRIRVPGELDESWLDWVGEMEIAHSTDVEGEPVTILAGTLDQAALHSLLRRLYSLGIPLISVVCVSCGKDEIANEGWCKG